ncbi:MAG: Maf family protein [Nitriliruptoraceae bacterium]
MAEVITGGSHLVLASSSPRRAELLARLGVSPELRPTHIDETPQPGEGPAHLVERLAAAKAHAASTGDDDEVVLAADTVVVLGGEVLGKPRDREDAGRMLSTLSGRTHEVTSGIAVLRGRTRLIERVTTRVTFRRLEEAEIAWYVETGEPADKAGAYGLQGAGAVLVSHLDGSDTNVIGLALDVTVALLRQVGLDLLASRPSGS